MTKDKKKKEIEKKFNAEASGKPGSRCSCECNCANFPPDKTQANGHAAVQTHVSKVAI